MNRSRTAWAAVSRHSVTDGPTKDETIGAPAMFPPSSLHGYSLTAGWRRDGSEDREVEVRGWVQVLWGVRCQMCCVVV